jgi:hypothetical protein
VATTLAVRRDDLKRARILASAPIEPEGDAPRAVLRVDGFALTTNNTFYGVFGDALSFWNFFRLEEPGWGCVPAWGYSTVTSSDVPGVAVGDRYFGYVPMATELTVTPVNVGATSFVDGAANRPPAVPMYNAYSAAGADPLYSPELAPALMIFRPIYATSFVLGDFLADNAFFGAEQIVLSSASSKTAYGTAHALSKVGGPRVVGLTSERNRGFVEGLGFYDQVVTYAETGALPRARTAYVDVAGDPEIRTTLRRTLRDALVYDGLVGGTHWETRRGPSEPVQADDGTGAAAPTPFLAATQFAKRRKDWGPGEFQKRLTTALREFIARATDPARPWVRFVVASGPDAVLRAYDEVISGRAAPTDGHVLKL